MRRIILLQLIITLLLTKLLISGCSGVQSTPTQDNVATSIAESKAIAATLTAEIPPATKTTLPTTTPSPAPSTPTPIPTTGSIHGVLIGADSDQPITGAYIILCSVVDPTIDKPVCLLHADLITITDADGSFDFGKIKPAIPIIIVDFFVDNLPSVKLSAFC